jgi:ppGpp synthetase/RelA/SpoT-type nucleotidyltranferase
MSELFAFCSDVRKQTASILEVIRGETTYPVTPRDGKSFKSIVEKLKRESKLGLSQIQDIEGCRIVVDSRVEQDAIRFRLRSRLETRTRDRREEPSNGYRAVHVIARPFGVSTGPTYEIQIRTTLQHAWASLVEVLAAKDQSIKYGGIPAVQTLLQSISDLINEVERLEEHMFRGFLDNEGDDNPEALAEIATFFKKVSPDFFISEDVDFANFWNGIEHHHRRVNEIEESWASFLSHEILDWKKHLFGLILDYTIKGRGQQP